MDSKARSTGLHAWEQELATATALIRAGLTCGNAGIALDGSIRTRCNSRWLTADNPDYVKQMLHSLLGRSTLSARIGSRLSRVARAICQWLE